jgi:dipeptidyl aminopeptidase/acylaminoacyl peptidase
MGWSFGGYMTAWMVARTSLFKAAIVGAGMVDNALMWGTQDSPPHYAAYFGGDPFEKNLGDLYRERSPLTHIKNIRTPVLIMHGEEDKRVPASQALLFYNALKVVGADVELVWYPRTGHAPQEPRLRLDVVQRQAAWLSRHLLGTEMPLWPKERAGKAPRP